MGGRRESWCVVYVWRWLVGFDTLGMSLRGHDMRIEHVAVYTRDLERLRVFYERYFAASATTRYQSATRAGFTSHFLTFPDGGARLELMSVPESGQAPASVSAGYAHLAVSVGSRAAVDAVAERLQSAGVRILGTGTVRLRSKIRMAMCWR